MLIMILFSVEKLSRLFLFFRTLSRDIILIFLGKKMFIKRLYSILFYLGKLSTDIVSIF